jgi:hypothetical protein
MNRRLAAAVIAAFQNGPVEMHRARLAAFEDRDWMRTAEWLHTSGLALYFLQRTKLMGIEDVMPAILLRGLEQNHAENRVRTDDLFGEFVRINAEMQRAGVTYLNLKGFTLAPRACTDPTYRYQHDLDFLVCQRDAELCRQAVERHGYKLTAVFGDTWEFRAGEAEVCSMRDLYKVRRQRNLELHVVPDSDGDGGRLSRMQLQVWKGFEFPALSDCDQLLAQARHLFKHFQTEWTRTAWLLEYATAIRSHGVDEKFWRETVAAIETDPQTKVGIGAVNLITCRALGVALPAGFRNGTVDAVPSQVRLWLDRYGDEVVFTEHPGSKLYLLLRDVLLQDEPEWKAERRRKLFPSRLPPPAMVAARTDDVRLRVRTTWARVCRVWNRLHFHITQGLHYKVEAMRWKRIVGDLRA